VMFGEIRLIIVDVIMIRLIGAVCITSTVVVL